MIQKIIATRSGFEDVYCGIDPLLHQSPVEVQLHIPGSFELLENHLVHAALCLDQGRCQDSEAASFLTITCRAEETLRFQKSLGFHPSGHDASLPGLKCVISPRQPRDASQEDDYILFELHQSFRSFTYEFGYLNMSCRALVKSGAEYLAIQALP